MKINNPNTISSNKPRKYFKRKQQEESFLRYNCCQYIRKYYEQRALALLLVAVNELNLFSFFFSNCLVRALLSFPCSKEEIVKQAKIIFALNKRLRKWIKRNVCRLALAGFLPLGLTLCICRCAELLDSFKNSQKKKSSLKKTNYSKYL